MEKRIKVVFDTKIVVGLVIICAGVIFLLQNMGYATGIEVWDFWPVILILIGLGQLIRPSESRQPFGGFIILSIGVMFLLDNFDIIPYGIGELWPILVILGGLLVLSNAIRGTSPKAPASNDFISLSFVLGGGDFKFSTKNLKGGKIDAILGGGVIDLREADIQEDEIVINIFALMGGIEIKVPENWHVNVQVSPLLGAIENKTSFLDRGKPARKLTIRGTAIMGGVEIKN